MKKYLFILIILITSCLLSAQSEIDSLQILLAKHKTADTVKVNLLNDIAWEYFSKSEFEKQLNFAQKAYNLALELDYKKGEIKSLNYMGHYYKTKPDYTLALEYFQKTLKVSEEIDDKKEVARSYERIGSIYFEHGNYTSALEYFQKSLKISEKTADRNGISGRYIDIGKIYRFQGDYTKALEYYQKSLKIREELGNKIGISECYNNIGIIYSIQGNYSKALEYYQKSLKIDEELGDKSGISACYNNIGIIYKNQGNYPKASEYYQKSLKIGEELGDKSGNSITYNNIGNIYKYQGDYDNALKYHQKSLKIQKELDDKSGISATYNNIGEIYSLHGDYPIAYKYYQKSLKISIKIGDKYSETYSYFGLGSLYLEQKRTKEAYNYSKKAYTLAEEIGNAELIKKSSEILAKSSEALGRYKEAYKTYVVFKTMNDSLFNEENLKKITDLEYQYKYEKEKQAIELEQQKKDALNEKEIEKQAAVRNWIIAAFFLMMLLAFYIFRSYRIKLKSNLILRKQKDEIQDKNKQLKSLADQLQQMDQVKSNFFANISHEFRTPLTLVISPLKKLLDDSKYPGLRKTFNLMLRNAQRQLTLVDQLLDLSKIEIKKMKLQASLASLNKFTKVMISSFHSLAEEMSIRLIFIEEEKNIEIYFDQDKLHKIISNLVSNAFKFTPPKGTISVIIGKVETASRDNNRNYVKLIVQDNGIGIPEEYIEHIFDRFYQVDSSATRRFEGTGIGLALTKELVELHHGEIMVHSKTNKGTEFIVHLPLGKDHLTEDEIIDATVGVKQLIYDFDDSSQHFEDEDSLPPENISKNAPMILIVEDNQDMRNYIGESLYDGYNLIEAKDGEQGFDQAIKHIPDLIISDVMMPGMDGFELTKKLKEDISTSHIPIILLTAKAGDESKIIGLETGADAYVNKPFNTKELLVRAKNLIEQRQKLREKFKKNITIDPSEVTVTSVDEDFLRKAAGIVEKHMDNPEFSVEQFSIEMSMDRNNLFRKLKKIINQSSSQFIRTIRLKRAAQLLQQKTAPIGEIAYMVGFDKPSYFTECFKKQFGVTPSEFGGE